MKKVLLASTALVLTTGFAFADGHAGVSVGGSAGIWIEDNGSDDPTVNTDIEIDFSASGETDGGMGFGFDYTIQNATGAIDVTDAQDGSLPLGGGAAEVDNWEAYLTFGSVELRTGDPDDALQKAAGMGDIGFDGLGVDNVAEQARGDGDADGVLVTVSAGDFKFFVSHNSDLGNDDIAVGAKGSFGDVSFGLGFEDQGTANGDTMAADIGASFGDASIDLYYEDSDALGSGFGVEVGYDLGDVSLSLGFADHDNVADSAMGIGFGYDLGGGAELEGGVADNGTDTVWDLGVSMSF